MSHQIQLGTIQKITTPLLIVVVSLGIGYYAGQEFGRQKREQMLTEIFDNAVFANNLYGIITAIAPDKKSLSVEVGGVSGINFPNDYRSKTVLVAKDTKIVLREHKNQEVLDEEIAKYQSDAEGAKNPATFTPPLPYMEKDISVDDLKVGDRIDFNFSLDTDGGAALLNNQFVAIEVAITR
jgi:hypothetical protein